MNTTPLPEAHASHGFYPVKFALVSAAILAACGLATSSSAAPLADIRIVNDRAPDCSSIEALIASVTRECKTDDERAIAIYNAAYYLYYHHAYPSEASGDIGALKMLNVYGWSLCGGEHTVLAALWEKAGYKWRYRGWSNPGHTTVECFYGGRWHYLDTFLRFYAWMPDPAAPGGRTIAGQEDIKANPALVTEGFVTDPARAVSYHKDDRFELIGDKANWTAPAFMNCGDTLASVLTGIASSNNAGSPRGWAGLTFDEPGYSAAVNLDAGYALTLDWDKVADGFYFRGMNRGALHTCGDKDYRNDPSNGPLLEPYAKKDKVRSWSNGTLRYQPDLRSGALLETLRQADNVAWGSNSLLPKDASRPGSFVIEMASPYVVAKAAGKIASVDAKTEVSLDGKAWKPTSLDDLTSLVAGNYRYEVRVTFTKPITALELTSIVQHNQEALPYLAPGKNVITIASAKPADLGRNRLIVTYAYCLGSRSATPEELYAQGAEISRAHNATWADTPIVVQKSIERFPATIEIAVPTPAGRQPVYPRMLFLRREVLAPGQQPMPVPAPPSTPAVGANETLATLPNPWLIGARAPAAVAPRPTKSTTVPLPRISHVSMAGEVRPHQFVKWQKDNSAAWIMLIGTDGLTLPPARDVASAHLVFYVSEAHDKADMQAAAVALKVPFETGKPYDFKNLDAIVGTTTIKKGGGESAPLVPPVRYEIDVTKAVRAWAAGEKPNGLALRIVPNRAVDDGWTVNFTPDAMKLPELVVTTFTAK